MNRKIFRDEFKIIGPAPEIIKVRNTLDRYGFSWLLSNNLSIAKPKRAFSVVWQHGIYFDLPNAQRRIQPYKISSSNNDPYNYLIVVANEDDCRFVKSNGFQNVVTAGMPFAYTEPSGIPRKNVLLAIPAHSGDEKNEKISIDESYLEYLYQFKKEYDQILISAYSLDSDLEFYNTAISMGFDVVCGAAPNDKNSLQRTRALFDYSAHVTTNTHGSHVYYALACGCNTSICGPLAHVSYGDGEQNLSMKAVSNDKLLKETYILDLKRKGFVTHNLLSASPLNGIIDKKLGEYVIGSDFVLTDKKVIKAIIRWGMVDQLNEYKSGFIRRTNRFIFKDNA